MSSFRSVCKVQDVPPGEGKVVALGGKIVAVFRVNEQFYAIDDVCPHMGASLGAGGAFSDGRDRQVRSVPIHLGLRP